MLHPPSNSGLLQSREDRAKWTRARGELARSRGPEAVVSAARQRSYLHGHSGVCAQVLAIEGGYPRITSCYRSPALAVVRSSPAERWAGRYVKHRAATALQAGRLRGVPQRRAGRALVAGSGFRRCASATAPTVGTGPASLPYFSTEVAKSGGAHQPDSRYSVQFMLGLGRTRARVRRLHWRVLL